MKPVRSPIGAETCPCGKGLYADCCEPLHAGAAAASAEALMRSRYSAYVLELPAYLLATWHPSTRPTDLPLDEPTQWLGLEVRQHEEDGATGSVGFVARYKLNGRAYRLRELSRFVREDGRWYYVDGDLSEK